MFKQYETENWTSFGIHHFDGRNCVVTAILLQPVNIGTRCAFQQLNPVYALVWACKRTLSAHGVVASQPYADRCDARKR